MDEAEEILSRNLKKNGCFNVYIYQQEIYDAVIGSINEALNKKAE